MTAELKGIHAKTFQDLDVIKDVLKLDEEKIAELEAQIEKMKSDYEQLLDEKIELEDRLAESRECY